MSPHTCKPCVRSVQYLAAGVWDGQEPVRAGEIEGTFLEGKEA